MKKKKIDCPHLITPPLIRKRKGKSQKMQEQPFDTLNKKTRRWKEKEKTTQREHYSMHRHTEKGAVNLFFGWYGVFSSVFSLIWGENILVGPGRKHPGPINFFFLPSLQSNTHQKCFPSLFFLFFFILPKIHPTKHTLRPSLVGIKDREIENRGKMRKD